MKMEQSINAWMVQNNERTKRIGLKIKGVHSEFITIQIGKHMIQLTIPSSFQNESSSDLNDDLSFLAIPLEEEDDEEFYGTLEILNGKLQRIKATFDCITKVFDVITQVFEGYICKTAEKQDQRGEEKEKREQEKESHEENEKAWATSDDESSDVEEIYHYYEDVILECDKSLPKADERSDLDGILPNAGNVVEDSRVEGGTSSLTTEGNLVQEEILPCERSDLEDKVAEDSRVEGGKSSLTAEEILVLEEKFPCVYRLAEDARMECERALSIAVERADVDGMLPWCSVTFLPEVKAVELEMELKGIMDMDNAAMALGFWFDDPLKIQVSFKSFTWTVEDFYIKFFKYAEVFVKENTSQVRERDAYMERVINGVVDGLDHRIMNAVIECCSSGRMQPYGPHVLVPDLVREFLKELEIGSDDSINGMGQVIESDNVFISLLIFLGSRLRNLKKWCTICKRPLPPFSHQWYCDSPHCLCRFADQGIGTSMVHQVKDPELVDFQLNLALAATSRSSDAFQPYTTFLLTREEMRLPCKKSKLDQAAHQAIKSNQFISSEGESSLNKASTSDQSTSSKEENYSAKRRRAPLLESIEQGERHGEDSVVDKSLDLFDELLRSLLLSTHEMKSCVNELELVMKLGISWLKTHQNIDNNRIGLSQEDDAENIWLPYNALKYVLFMYNLSLHPIQKDCRLNIGGCLYQFAVFYDFEREQNFQHRRTTEGSILAFHGSDIGNWHSILRNGLRCSRKKTDIFYGVSVDGIHFHTSTSGAFSHSYDSEPRSQYSVIALCEIFSAQKHFTLNSCLVVSPENEMDVAIRYLFVYDHGITSVSYIEVSGGEMWYEKNNLYDHYRKLWNEHIQQVHNERLIIKYQSLDLIRQRSGITSREHPLEANNS